MKWSSAYAQEDSLEDAINTALTKIKQDLNGNSPDLVFTFISHHFADRYTKVPNIVFEQLTPKHFAGCSAGGVIGDGHEIENRPGFSIIAGYLPDVSLVPFHFEAEDLPDMDASPESWEKLVGVTNELTPQFILLADPFTFPAERLIQGLDYAFPKSIKTGGLASGGNAPGQNALYLGDHTYRSGAIGIALEGNITIDTIVAQGCRPVGQLMEITSSKGNLLIELDGRPAIEALRDLFATLNEGDQDLARHSLFLGLAMDEFRSKLGLGDFLIRNILGMDPSSGAIAIGELPREGQQVQFHIRDSRTSGEELEGLLKLHADDHDCHPVCGALLFSCLGRGEYLYGHADHDTNLFEKWLGKMPLGGFFCNGEIGPVGNSTFLHGYTSSFALIRPRSQ